MKDKRPFRIGNQTSFAAAWPLEPFEFAAAQGFAAFEFFPNRGFAGRGGWDERELDAATRRYIRQTASAIWRRRALGAAGAVTCGGCRRRRYALAWQPREQ